MSALATSTRDRIAALFYRHFFHFLLITAAMAEWACVAWFAWSLAGVTLPLPAHAAAVMAISLFNRVIIVSRRRAGRGSNPALRVYTAVAFIGLFCLAFLMTSGAVW